MDYIVVIGGGLAGCEAAYQIAKRGIKVKLYEMKPNKFSEAHSNENLAEIVCSNSFKSNLHTNACGLLKEELRLLDSLLIKIADETRVPAGQALAVDREIFSKRVTEEIKNNPLIEVINEEVTNLNDFIKEGIVIIATGPLTSNKLSEEISKLTGEDKLHFYDAAAPIIEKESILCIDCHHLIFDGASISVLLNSLLSILNNNVGDIVDSNTVIGKQGNTGLVASVKSLSDVTYGSHVHLEITDKDGNYINPRKYATGEIVTDYIIQSNELDETKNQFKVMVDKINIREKPTVDSIDIGDVFYGEIYTILDEVLDDKYNWYHIKTSTGIDGYVANEIGFNWLELYKIPFPCGDKCMDNNDKYKLLFTCSETGTYYIKLFEGEELYIKEKS